MSELARAANYENVVNTVQTEIFKYTRFSSV